MNSAGHLLILDFSNLLEDCLKAQSDLPDFLSNLFLSNDSKIENYVNFCHDSSISTKIKKKKLIYF